MPTLLDLPDIPMREIIEKLDFVSTQCLRKTCRDTRDSVDNAKLDFFLEEISVSLNKNSFDLSIFFNDGNAQISYIKEKDGCTVKYRRMNEQHKKTGNNKFLNYGNAVEMACKDVESILKNQKSTIKIGTFRYTDTNEETVHAFLNCLGDKNIKVDSFLLKVSCLDHIISTLQRIECSELIIIMTPEMDLLDLSEVVELDQWKKAKTVLLRNCIVDLPIEKFINFKEIYVTYKTVTKEMVLDLKDAFFSHTHMECFELTFHENDYETPLIEIYGQPSEIVNFGIKERKWFFEIPNSEQVLVISLHSYYISMFRMELKDVPENGFLIQ